VPKEVADEAFDAATCIGCGACVAACPNASSMLFTSAKAAHLNMLPQGKTEASNRAERMTEAQDREGFGGCSNVGACEMECPKGISLTNIAKLNRDYFGAAFKPSMYAD
jgi:succinate dehydrogenase / fumarate reductase iron-sulfur subunit